MPLEAKGFRHRAVVIPIVAVAGHVTVDLGEQRAHPQQLNFVEDESGVGWHGGQPFKRSLRFR